MYPNDQSPFGDTLDSYMRRCVTDLVCSPEVVYTVSSYVEAAKLVLLKHRVRDFKASDVVALAAVMEQRDRAQRLQSREE